MRHNALYGVLAAAVLLAACTDSGGQVTSKPTSTTTTPPTTVRETRPPAGEGYWPAMAFDTTAGVVVAVNSLEGRETWVFDVVTDRWTKRGARAPAGVRVSGFVYSPDAGAVLMITSDGGVFAYDVAGDAWKERPANPASLAARPWIATLDQKSGDVIGLDHGESTTVWSYNVRASTWTEVAQQGGPAIPSNGGPVMVYDPIAGGIVVLDYNADLTAAVDTWLLDLEHRRWTQLSSLPPISFGYFAHGTEATYATHQRRVIVFSGGVTAEYDASTSTWATYIDLRQLGTGELATQPLNRSGAALVYDPINERVLMCGGANFAKSADEYRNDMWAYDMTTHTWSIVLEATNVPTP